MRTSEEGSALVMSLLIVIALSVIGAALTVLSLSETYGSMNYRMMSQARYAAESAVQKAAGYLINCSPAAACGGYTLPGATTDPLSNYDLTVSPVTYSGQPVLLSGISGVASNYPAPATRAAFNATVNGTLAVTGAAVQYSASAKLMSMRAISPYGGGAPSVVQTWQITGDGTVTGARAAFVEVSATLERQVVGAGTFAAFATAQTCGAITFSGSASTDSYDSSAAWVSGHPVIALNTGNVGTNGNLTESGGVTINGSLSTPRTGVGSCSAGAVDAQTSSGSAVVTSGLIQLPQALLYTAPALPSPLPSTATQGFSHNTGCGAVANCSLPDGAGTPNHLKFTGGATSATASSFGSVSLSSDVVLHLGAATGCPCYYNFNSLTMSGATQLVIDGGPIILNIAGQTAAGTWMASPLTVSGGGLVNSTLNPFNLQIQYGGTAGVSLSGGTSSSAMLFAPNAPVTLSGGSDFYGSLLGLTVTDSGGTHIHYDRRLSSSFSQPGNWMLSSFNWKKY